VLVHEATFQDYRGGRLLLGFRAFRRLSNDYEVLPSREEAWISIAMIRIMLRRLTQNSS
jgi:transposase